MHSAALLRLVGLIAVRERKLEKDNSTIVDINETSSLRT